MGKRKQESQKNMQNADAQDLQKDLIVLEDLQNDPGVKVAIEMGMDQPALIGNWREKGTGREKNVREKTKIETGWTRSATALEAPSEQWNADAAGVRRSAEALARAGTKRMTGKKGKRRMRRARRKSGIMTKNVEVRGTERRKNPKKKAKEI